MEFIILYVLGWLISVGLTVYFSDISKQHDDIVWAWFVLFWLWWALMPLAAVTLFALYLKKRRGK